VSPSALRFRPPGLYRERDVKRFSPLALRPNGIPGFIGITEKGPSHEPVEITSYEHFVSVFGTLHLDSYLAPALQGFFLNGGRTCFVCRVTHTRGGEARDRSQHAALLIRDKDNTSTLQVRALSEGAWANGVQLSFSPSPPRVQTLLTLDLHAGAHEIAIRSTHGFQRGTVIRIHDDDKEMIRIIQEVGSRSLAWDMNQPSEHEFASSAPTMIEPLEYSFQVAAGSETESWNRLSAAPASERYFERVINEASRLVQVDDILGQPRLNSTPLGDIHNATLSGGQDGITSLTPEDFIGENLGPDHRTGLKSLEASDQIDLLVAPDLMWCRSHTSGFRTDKHVESVQHEMVHQAERCRDRMAILDIPGHLDHQDALTWRQMFDSDFAALYFPWIAIASDTGTREVPPAGHVAGVYSRVGNTLGIHVPPANQELRGAVDLNRILHDDDLGHMNNRGLNCLQMLTARGIRIWGSRTASSDGSLQYVNVRRVLSAIIRTLSLDLQWVVFEPNQPSVWKVLERNIGFFLTDMWRAGAFVGAMPQDAFFVRCNEETNPPETRDAGMIIVEVGVAIVRPAEFIVFRVEQEIEDIS